MTNRKQHSRLVLCSSPRVSALALALVWVLTMAAMQPAQAQTFKVLRNFTVRDGESPSAGLTMDRAGSLYGTTLYGGAT